MDMAALLPSLEVEEVLMLLLVAEEVPASEAVEVKLCVPVHSPEVLAPLAWLAEMGYDLCC